MRVLIAYGSKMGGTHGLANWLAHDIEELGDFEVDVRAAEMVSSVSSYDAVIVGGALYTFRWHPEARRFVRRFQKDLQRKPVWLFSSGPLDDSSLHEDILPVRFVRNTIDKLGARGHITFGGRLVPEPQGSLAKTMAKEQAGDWRDPEQVREWAAKIAAELTPIH